MQLIIIIIMINSQNSSRYQQKSISSTAPQYQSEVSFTGSDRTSFTVFALVGVRKRDSVDSNLQSTDI